MWRLLDFLKSAIIRLFWGICIIALIAVIVNGIMKVGEIKNGYDGKYKSMYRTTENKAMNLYITGNGDKTILLMPGFGVGNPEVYYKPIIEKLNDMYRVVVVDYLGYGFSSENKKDRTSETIINEVRGALETANIKGPFILMPHSLSNVYATYYANTFPEEVQAIIGIDGLAPNILKEETYKTEITETILNTRICYVAEKFAIVRILKFFNPEMFDIDEFDNTAYFDDEDRELINQYFCPNYLTTTMLIEAGQIIPNLENVQDTLYNENLPVLQIVASETAEESNKLKEDGTVQKTKTELMIETFTNSTIQMVTEIEGGHMLNFDNPDAVVNSAVSFIESFM